MGFTGEPDTFNRYSYVANNPDKFTDPTAEAKYKGDKSGIAATNLVAKGVVSVTDKGTPANEYHDYVPNGLRVKKQKLQKSFSKTR